jgi:hypothetical protein
VNGAGLLLAFTEANLAGDQNCKRSCCHLSKAGPGYASSCCALRCGEDVSETGSEPARERSTFGQPDLLNAATTLVVVPPSLFSNANRSLVRSGDRPLLDGQPDLNIQHSVLLV